MNFDILRSMEILAATPETLRSLLGNLSEEWTLNSAPSHDEVVLSTGAGQAAEPNAVWQPYDILGHLIHGEQTDWIPRARIILEQNDDRRFVPFDRFAQFENSRGKSVSDLLDEFERLRSANLETLRAWKLTEESLDLPGVHPELGPVTLRQLLATWVVHDLNHIRQIVSVMAKRYDAEVGVWKEYLSILNP